MACVGVPGSYLEFSQYENGGCTGNCFQTCNTFCSAIYDADVLTNYCNAPQYFEHFIGCGVDQNHCNCICEQGDVTALLAQTIPVDGPTSYQTSVGSGEFLFNTMTDACQAIGKACDDASFLEYSEF